MQKNIVSDYRSNEDKRRSDIRPFAGKISRFRLRGPYLIFIGHAESPMFAKTGLGLVQWCPDRVIGQLRLDKAKVDLGVPDLSIDEAFRVGARSLVIGDAPAGGAIEDSWISVMNQAATAGMDIVSGLHMDLNSVPGLAEAAKRSGASLVNVRKPPENLSVGTGLKRTGRRILTVGTDCAVGKKYSALAMTAALKDRGHNATFRATGQTGIIIAGEGLPIDAVVSDFVSGAAEILSPDNAPDHWDVIEGQGSLFNASFAGVSLGLLHGSQPDAIIVCDDPSRELVSTCPQMHTPTVAECLVLNLQLGKLTNPDIFCVAVCLNTSSLSANARASYLRQMSCELGVLCLDPMIDGCGAIVDLLEASKLN